MGRGQPVIVPEFLALFDQCRIFLNNLPDSYTPLSFMECTSPTKSQSISLSPSAWRRNPLMWRIVGTGRRRTRLKELTRITEEDFAEARNKIGSSIDVPPEDRPTLVTFTDEHAIRLLTD